MSAQSILRLDARVGRPVRFAHGLSACGSAPDWGQGEGPRISRRAHELECGREPYTHGLAALMGGQRSRSSLGIPRGAVAGRSRWTGAAAHRVITFRI
jgi:hypothetical protein